MSACQICVLGIAVAGFAVGFITCVLYGGIREANACRKYWTARLEELKKGQE